MNAPSPRTSPHLAISDHALLRFLERAAGLDIEELRLRLESSLVRAHAAARSLTASDYLIRADGLLYIVRGETVTSVVPDKDPTGCAYTLEGKGR